MMPVKQWNLKHADHRQSLIAPRTQAKAAVPTLAASKTLPRPRAQLSKKMLCRRREAEAAVSTLRRLWNYLPGGKLRRIVAQMMNEEPPFVDLDNKIRTEQSGSLAVSLEPTSDAPVLGAAPRAAPAKWARKLIALSSPVDLRQDASLNLSQTGQIVDLDLAGGGDLIMPSLPDSPLLCSVGSCYALGGA